MRKNLLFLFGAITLSLSAYSNPSEGIKKKNSSRKLANIEKIYIGGYCKSLYGSEIRFNEQVKSLSNYATNETNIKKGNIEFNQSSNGQSKLVSVPKFHIKVLKNIPLQKVRHTGCPTSDSVVEAKLIHENIDFTTNSAGEVVAESNQDIWWLCTSNWQYNEDCE